MWRTGPPSWIVPPALCPQYEAEATQLLKPLDHVAFLEEPASLAPILTLVGLPTGRTPIAMPHSNCRARRNQIDCVRPLHSKVKNAVANTNSSKALVTAAQWALASEANACSSRVYETLRERWATTAGLNR